MLMLPAMMQAVRTYADKVVQVPQMAESISEGTLKQFSKQIGEFVEQDEEIATIETDKVRLLRLYEISAGIAHMLTPMSRSMLL